MKKKKIAKNVETNESEEVVNKKAKKKKEKVKKSHHPVELIGKIFAILVIIAMVLSVSATCIYYLMYYLK